MKKKQFYGEVTGEWQNIEYISYSHCGNSYYSFGFIPDQ